MGRRLLFFVLLQGLRLLRSSCKVQVHGLEHLPRNSQGKLAPFAMALWHQNLIAAVLAESGRMSFATMVSRSKDGDAMAYVVQALGHTPARGSARRGPRDKGGGQALEALIEQIRAGRAAGITVDGPTGPAHKVKAGIVDMAAATGVPIIPYLAIADRYWSFNSWDRIRLPKPFSTIHAYYGPPVPQPEAFDASQRRALRDAIAAAMEEQEQAHHSDLPRL